MRILIVKLGAIGDIIHALPALALIRHRIPDAEISWAAESRSAEILRGNKLIDNLIEVDTRSLRGGKVIENMLIDAARQVKNLRQHDFDIAIDLQGLLKSGVIAKLSGAKSRWGFSRTDLRESAARIFYTDTVKLAPMTHVIRQNIAAVAEALGIDPTDGIDFPVFTSESDRLEADELARRAGPQFAILNPAGGWVTKLWPAENFGLLADRIFDETGMTSIVVTGPKEKELADRVMSTSRSGHTIAAEPSLKGFYELARQTRLYVGGDTGPTHLALAAGAPIVGLFGPTEWWRNGSLDADDVCVERLDIDCRVDCHRRTCSNWICMDISVKTVFDAVKARLERKEKIGSPLPLSKL